MGKKIYSPFIILVTFVLLYGCQDDNQIVQDTLENTELLNSQTKLKWLAQWYGEGAKEDFIRESAREFSFLNQDYDVELEFPHEMGGIDFTNETAAIIIDSIVQMVKKDEWPFDLMVCYEYVFDQVGIRLGNPNWGTEHLVEFRNESWFIDAHKDNFFATDKYLKGFKGMAPGIFIEGIYDILYVSSEVENKLGIKIKDYDMTISDLIYYAKTVFEYNKVNDNKITFAYFPWGYSDRLFNYMVISSFEGNVVDNREHAFEVLKECYQAFEQLSKYLPLEQYVPLNDGKELVHDKVLFNYHLSWINDIWKKGNLEGEKLMRPCEIPTLDNKLSRNYAGTYGCVFVVPKKAKNRKGAEKLMKFLSTQNSAEKWTKYSRSGTGLKVRFTDSDFSNDVYANFSNHIKKKYNDRVLTVNLTNFLFNSNQYLNFNTENVLRGDISAEQALNDVIAQLGEQ